MNRNTRTTLMAVVFTVLMVVSMPAMAMAGGSGPSTDHAESPFLEGVTADGAPNTGDVETSGELETETVEDMNLDVEATSESGGTVYVGSNDNNLYAIDAETQEELWSFETSGQVRSSPIVLDGTVYFGSFDNNLYAVDAETGEEEWSFDGGNDIYTSPTVVNGSVYIVVDGGTLYSVDAETGDEEWAFEEPTSDFMTADPKVADGTVYFGSDDDEAVYAVDSETGEKEWENTQMTSRVTTTAYADGTVFAGTSTDETMYAIDAETGDEEWRFEEPAGSVYSEAEVIDGTAYFGASDDTLYAVDVETGEKEWESPVDARISIPSPTYVEGTLYIGTNGGTLYAFDAETGDEEWTFTDPTDEIRSTATVADGTVYVGSHDNNFYAIDAETGDLEGTFTGASDNVYSSPTYVSDGSDMSDGARAEHHTFGHHDGVTAGGHVITGQVTDQDVTPVSEATLTVWGIAESALDPTDSRTLERQAEDLRDELTDPIPDDYQDHVDEFEDAVGENRLDSDALADEIDATYPMVHSEDDWGTGYSTIISEEVDAPRFSVDPGDPVVLSLWDPAEDGGVLPGDIDDTSPVRSSHTGAPVDGNIVVEQLGPTSEPVDRSEFETSVEFTENRYIGSDREWHAVRTSLPTGVYRVHPEDSPEASTYVVVGDPDDLSSQFEADLRDEADELIERSEQIRDMLDNDEIVRESVQTNETGHFEVEMPSSVVSANLQAMKADGELLETVEDPSIEDLREHSLTGYNGTYYLPSPKPETVYPPAEDVHVTTYRSPDVPMGDIDSFADLMAHLEEQRLNEKIEDLFDEYDERLEEMERERLLQVYAAHANLIETVPGAEDDYLETSSFDEVQDGEDLSNDDLQVEIELMQLSLSGLETIEPPSLPEPEIEDGELYVEVPLPAGIDSESISPELHWSDGTNEAIPEEYYSIESGGVFGGEELIVDGYPVDTDDPAAFEVRVLAGGDDGQVDWRLPPGLNPGFDGKVPAVRAIDVNTLSPGPDERVSLTIRESEDDSFEAIESVEVFGPDGDEIGANVTEDGASFRTNATGQHTVRLTVTDKTGEPFVKSFSLRAFDEPRSDPPTIRVDQSTIGKFAIAGEGIRDAEISEEGDTTKLSAIVHDGETPGSVHVHAAGLIDGGTSEIDVNVLEGSDERSIHSTIETVVHLENVDPESTNVWRGQPSTFGEPLDWDGGTRYGDVIDRNIEKPGDKVVIRTYSDGSGTTTLTIDEDASGWSDMQHSLALRVPRVSLLPSLPFSLTGLTATLVSLVSVAGARRYVPPTSR